MLEKCVLTVLELNWNKRLGHKKTKLNICNHMLTSSTQLQNMSFHVVERTRSAFLLYGKTGKNFRVKGTGKFSSVKMVRDERVPFTPIYVKKTLNPPNSNIN